MSALVGERRTMVFFEAPHRLAASLAAMAEVFGAERAVAVCRELTKTYEEVRRGPVGGLVEWASEARGEITIVVAGASAPVADLANELDGIRSRVAAGERLKEVCAEVAARTGLSKKALYDAIVAG